MKNKLVLNPLFVSNEKEIVGFIEKFDTAGVVFIEGKRNKIKLFEIAGKTVNIKSFKKPGIINKLVYKLFRKSKAKRSFEYATTLLENNIGTPEPIAFFEKHDLLGLKESYYASEHLVTELTFRELVQIPDYPQNEIILRQFTRFSFDLHEKGIEFLDHSPGNTLIKKVNEGEYNFYLVDLNRMKFHESMDFETRMKNLRRLTPQKGMVSIMSNEYAKLYNKTEAEIFERLWFHTSEFQNAFAKKKRLKKKLLFWK
ncbi:MAG: lipopolysaccharide kinase InaA family protein [Bacteroidota bacterium]